MKLEDFKYLKQQRTITLAFIIILYITLFNAPKYSNILIGAISYTGILRRMKILNEEDVQLIRGIFGEKITKNIAKIMNIQ